VEARELKFCMKYFKNSQMLKKLANRYIIENLNILKVEGIYQNILRKSDK
jgi:hypothetical protein